MLSTLAILLSGFVASERDSRRPQGWQQRELSGIV